MEWSDHKMRCRWANPQNPRYIHYHDTEWGIPLYDDQKLFEPLYARMLLSGERSGKTEQVLARLTSLFTQDADDELDRVVDMVEPAISAFLTVAVGITLLSVMLPLIGILGTVG